MCCCIKALIERGDEAVKQTVDDEENTFLHVAAKSGAIKSIKVSNKIKYLQNYSTITELLYNYRIIVQLHNYTGSDD